MKWTIRSLIKTTTDFLRERVIEEPRLTTELLLAHALDMKRVSLYLSFDKPIRKDELSRFRTLVKRRLAHEPVQYIIGSTGFMGLDIGTRKEVFIPRQETEILVSIVKLWIESNDLDTFELYDIGTGTGAIALFFAHSFSNVKVYVSDISECALECARENAKNLNVEARITFIAGDLLEPFKKAQKADIIISNPPYIPSADVQNLPEIVKREPREALDGGKDGLFFIGKIINEAKEYLKPEGLLALEIGNNQSEQVKELFSRENVYKNITIVPDLRGIKRVATAMFFSYL